MLRWTTAGRQPRLGLPSQQGEGARERLSALEQSLAEREGLPPAARALAEQGEQLFDGFAARFDRECVLAAGPLL